MEQSNKLIITDEQNNQKEMEIMFTFTYNSKEFVVYFDPNDNREEIEVFASIYDSAGNLYPIESEEEWDVVDQMVESFTNDEEDDNNSIQ